MTMVDRRELLKTALTVAAANLPGVQLATAASAAPPLAGTGAPKPFDYAWIKGQARGAASGAYQPSKDLVPPAMTKLNYDQYNSLRFRNERSLWLDAGTAFRVQFFHAGRGFAPRR